MKLAPNIDSKFPPIGSIWRNRKTQVEFRVLGISGDATNAIEGDIKIRYAPLGGMPADLAPLDSFVRELSEFLSKFDCP